MYKWISLCRTVYLMQNFVILSYYISVSQYLIKCVDISQVLSANQCEDSDSSMSLSSESDEQYVSENQILPNQQSMYGWIYFMMLYLLFFFSRISEGYYKDNLSLPVFMTGTATLLPEEKVKTLQNDFVKLCQLMLHIT